MTKIFPALLLAALATPAVAEPAANITSIVNIADLDLSNAAGQRVLDRRLAQAVNEVCGDASPADLAGQNKVRACRVETRARLDADREQRIAKISTGPIVVASR